MIEDMARGLGASVVAVEAPFNPEGGAYVRPSAARGQEHAITAHAHDHAHGHGHGHDRASRSRASSRRLMASTTTRTTITATAMTTITGRRAEPDAALLPLMLWLSPAFPVGSFAYSHGLEWAFEAGDIFDAARSAAGSSTSLVFRRAACRRGPVRAAFRAAAAADWPALDEANALAVALAASAERRLETTAQGAAFLAAARAAWDCEPLRGSPREERVAYPVAVAAAAAGHAWLGTRLAGLRRWPLANLVSAAVRLARSARPPGRRSWPRSCRASARWRARRRARRSPTSAPAPPLRHRRDAPRDAIFAALPLVEPSSACGSLPSAKRGVTPKGRMRSSRNGCPIPKRMRPRALRWRVVFELPEFTLTASS